uniref:Uncharacterized protein n=1 Tax=Lepeophtheirus salmonis TaxID=72036 RepID=A0A0K2TMP8_LEPSM
MSFVPFRNGKRKMDSRHCTQNTDQWSK